MENNRNLTHVYVDCHAPSPMQRCPMQPTRTTRLPSTDARPALHPARGCNEGWGKRDSLSYSCSPIFPTVSHLYSLMDSRVIALGLMGRSMQRPEWVAAANDLVVSIQARAVQDFGFSLGPGGTARAGYKTPHLIPTFMQGLAGIAFASLVGPSSTALVPLLVGGTNQQ